MDVEQTISAREVAFYILGNLPLTNTVNIFAKVGRSRFETKAKLDIPGTPTEKVTGNDNIYRVGARFDLDEDSAVRLEYESSNDNAGSTLISFGFMHLF